MSYGGAPAYMGGRPLYQVHPSQKQNFLHPWVQLHPLWRRPWSCRNHKFVLSVLDGRVGLRYATLQTTLRYVCIFGQNYATELRNVMFRYVTELR